MLRVRAKLRRKVAPAAVGADEVARDARKPAGRVHVGWRRECPPGARVSSSLQRAFNRLVPLITELIKGSRKIDIVKIACRWSNRSYLNRDQARPHPLAAG